MAGPSSRLGGDDEPDPYTGIDTQSALNIIQTRIAELTGFAATITENRDSPLDADRRLAQSMAAAVLSDGPLLANHVREEEIATHDRGLALRANQQMEEQRKRGVRNPDMLPLTDADLPNVRNECEEELVLLAKMAGLYVSESAARTLMPGDVLAAETRLNGQGPLQATHACTACTDDKTRAEIYTTPCNHEYCGGCLVILFRHSYKDESLFPPRCCQRAIPISDKVLCAFLPKLILDYYPTRKIEVESTDRTYCHQCEKFILPTAIVRRRATCGACRATTCSRCKRAGHLGPCPPDEAEQQVLELAEREGWKRCPGCRAMVELDYGSVAAGTSSATSVPRDGSHVHAPNGIRNACCAVQSRSSIEILYDPELPHNVNSVWNKWLANKRWLITAIILAVAGLGSMVLTDAKSAEIDCAASSSSADSVICVPAGGAAPIDFRQYSSSEQ